MRKELEEILDKCVVADSRKIKSTSGIYMIYNKFNYKIYIGSASNLQKRIHSHLSYLINRKHYSLHLQRSWNKYGQKNFIFYILEFVKDKKELINREQYYLNNLLFANCTDKRFDDFGYNRRRIADSPLGLKFTEEAKRNMSISKLGDKNGMFGKKKTEESRKKVSKNNAKYWTGKTHSEESRKKISKNHTNVKGSLNGFSKLNEKQVIEIRQRYKNENISMAKLGKEYGISSTNINDILKRKIWRHI